MNRKATAASIAILLSAAFVAGSVQAEQAGAAVTPGGVKQDTVVGNDTTAKYWFAQTSGDCEEAAFDAVYGDINGSRMHEATVEVEAEKLGVLSIPSADGSNWYGPDGLAKLGAHYGIKFTLGSHTLKTIEADLKAGDHVMAFVNAETIWATQNLTAIFGAPPAGDAWEPINAADGYDMSTGDHALVVDSIDLTTNKVTLTDTGSPAGAREVVSLSTFAKAVAGSGQAYAVTSKNGK